MRFAFSTAPQSCTWDEVLPIWQAADDVELFESGWTFDHFEAIFTGNRADPCMEGWITLTALLAATQRLRGGVLVTGMVYRHPAVLANMAATLDLTSSGRLELGIGAGWNLDECDAYGIELGSMTERFDRFAEGLEVMRLLLTQEVSDFQGQYFTLTGAYCNPKPVQQPHPPITIGGRGERRTMPLVARYAQHWNFPGSGPGDVFAECARLKRIVEDECTSIGRNPQEITMSANVWPRDGLDKVLSSIDRYAEIGLDLIIVSMPRPLAVADVERLAAALESRR
jgi:F420-dependent oxidoreductase-like protein